MAHAEFDGEIATVATGPFAHVIGRCRGILGMDKLQPSFVGVGEFGIGITKQTFPTWRITCDASFQIEVKETDCATGGEQIGPAFATGGRDGGDGWCDDGRGEVDLGEISGQFSVSRLDFKHGIDRCRFEGLRL